MQEAARREKRRLLDAQRGKCRVRLGSHLDEWCALKDHLGFSLHSQLAKFLLDSYSTTTSQGTTVPKAITLLSVSVPSLHRLAFLCQQHGRNCNSFPTILTQPSSVEAPETPVLLWGCKEDHQFYWDPHDYSVELGGSTEEDGRGLSSMYPNRTVGQDNVRKITSKEGAVVNTENKVNPPRPEIERLCEKQSRNYISSACQDNVNVRPEQWDDAGRITEHTLHITPGKEWLQKNNVSEKQQEQVTNEGLCQSIGHKIQVPSAEVGGTEDEDAGPPIVEDTQETISVDLAKKKPETPRSGQACRQRTPNLLSQSYQQALMDEPKAALSFTCRKSPRGTKGCRMKKTDVKEQVSHAKVKITNVAKVSSDMKGPDVDGLLGSAQNTNTFKRICHVQESLTGNIARQKTSSENFEVLVTVEQEEQPPGEPQSESVQMSRAAVGEVQNTQIEPLENKGLDPQNSQCRGNKASRCKSLVDEELAQICKKRIRKATPQELLMCEYDDCGKIFSKRQYLNYHQKYQHMNQRTFRCSVTECGKTFNFKKHLKEHEKRHSDRRDFICEFCARAFRSSSNLIIHRRIHTGEKPLQCEFCGFTCRQKASLNWHMKKHDADFLYEFPCDICGQRFEKRDNLAAHKSRKHPAPKETGPQETSKCITSCMGDSSQAEACCENDQTERLTRDQVMAPTARESVKEKLFPEYLDLSDNIQDVSQQTTSPSGNTGISLVIVL